MSFITGILLGVLALCIYIVSENDDLFTKGDKSQKGILLLIVLIAVVCSLIIIFLTELKELIIWNSL